MNSNATATRLPAGTCRTASVGAAWAVPPSSRPLVDFSTVPYRTLPQSRSNATS